jgi:CheY-like chemotaxis protein
MRISNCKIKRGKLPDSKSKIERIPIIAVTANAMKGDRERFLAAGMDDYIAKPIKRADLAEVIARCMK